MKLHRLHAGEWIALAAAIGLAVLLGLDWFFLSTPDARIGAHESGIRSLGWFAVIWPLAAVAAALAMVVATATQRAHAWPIVFTVFAFALGIIATVAIAARLVFQPGLGVDAGNADVEVELAAILGLAAAVLLTGGAWRGMMDERTGTAEARKQAEQVLAVRGGPLPAPPREAPAGPSRSA